MPEGPTERTAGSSSDPLSSKPTAGSKPVIFLSYSKERSEFMATVLWSLFKKVFPGAEPFVSFNRIKASHQTWEAPTGLGLTNEERLELTDLQTIGTDWKPKLEAKLTEAKVLVCCLTPENMRSHWIYYESGWVGTAPVVNDVHKVLLLELVKGTFLAAEPRREERVIGKDGALHPSADDLSTLCKKIATRLGIQVPEDCKLSDAITTAVRAFDEIRLMPASGPTSLPLLFNTSHRTSKEPAFTALVREVMVSEIVGQFQALSNLADPAPNPNGEAGDELFRLVRERLQGIRRRLPWLPKRLQWLAGAANDWRVFAICGRKGLGRLRLQTYYDWFVDHAQASGGTSDNCVVSRVFVDPVVPDLEVPNSMTVLEQREYHLQPGWYESGVRAFWLGATGLKTLQQTFRRQELASALRRKCGLVLFLNMEDPAQSDVYFHEMCQLAETEEHYCRTSRHSLIVTHFALAMKDVLACSELCQNSEQNEHRAQTEPAKLQDWLEKYLGKARLLDPPRVK